MEDGNVPSLVDICCCSISTNLFKSKIRWRKLSDLAFEFRSLFKTMKISPLLKKQLTDALTDVLAEANRWNSKHSEMFVDSKSKGRAMPKSEHLRTFYAHLVWKRNGQLNISDMKPFQSCILSENRNSKMFEVLKNHTLRLKILVNMDSQPMTVHYTIALHCEIDDPATCSNLITTECKNWPQLQFQFACLYAKTDIIFDDWKFDRHRLATFRKTLADHPVYDFWLTMMETKPQHFFGSQIRLPNQKLCQCFLFAIRNGYQQLVEYIWDRITNRDREAIGLIEWRNMCIRARDGNAIRFLCDNLCRINPIGTCRIAWGAFYDAFYHMIHDEKSDLLVKDTFRRKFEFLLKNSCPTLRSRLLKHANFRLICDSFRYNLKDIFSMLLHYMDPADLAAAREHIDRIFDRNKSKKGENMRKAMMRRQMTIG